MLGSRELCLLDHVKKGSKQEVRAVTRTSHGALNLINPFMMDDTTKLREAGDLLKAIWG